MDLYIRFLYGAIILSLVQGDLLDQGPQTFNQNVPRSAVNIPPGYEMKEVTMYLTPSQVKALEAARILVRADTIEGTQNVNQKLDEPSSLQDYFQEASAKQFPEDAFAKYLANSDGGQQLFQAKDPNHLPQVEEQNNEQDLSFTSGLQQEQDNISSPPAGIPSDHGIGYAYIHFAAHGQPETNIRMFYPPPPEYKLPEQSLFQKDQNFGVPNEFDSQQKNEWVPYVQNSGDNQNVQQGAREKQLFQQFHSHLLQNPAIKNKRIYRYANKKNRRSGIESKHH